MQKIHKLGIKNISLLNGIIKAIHSSKFIKRIIRQNLFWAIGYNIIAIPLAAIGMSLSSLLAVLNVLLL